MERENRKKRIEEAISYLMSIGLIDSRSPSFSIAAKMRRGKEGVSSAINGNERYLTWKFVKSFCATYSNIISADYIWNGTGEMTVNTKKEQLNAAISDESLMKLTREELVFLVKQLMSLHSEQTEMYRLLIRQNEEMIRNGQERFNNITNLIIKNVNNE